MAEPSSRSYNMRNPAVKRILQEVKEMAKEQNTEYMSMPLEEDIFEWQFAVHGPKDSEFEGGVYHGRITLPAEYPFKPPSFMLLTPSGRFEVQTKICLSISNHHPEHWQPSWSVRTALVALIAFMPTKPNGAIGSLDYTKKERRALAVKSRLQPPNFGSAERQRVILQLHEAMMKTAPPVPTTPLVEDEPSAPGSDENEEAARQPQQQEPRTHEQSVSRPAGVGPSGGGKTSHEEMQPQANSRPEAAVVEKGPEGPSSLANQSASPAVRAGAGQAVVATTGGPSAGIMARPNFRPAAADIARRPETETNQDRVLSVIAALLVIAILFILGQKIARAYTGVAFTGSESEL